MDMTCGYCTGFGKILWRYVKDRKVAMTDVAACPLCDGTGKAEARNK